MELNGDARMKLSQDIGKVTIPGKKDAYRLYGGDGKPEKRNCNYCSLGSWSSVTVSSTKYLQSLHNILRSCHAMSRIRQKYSSFCLNIFSAVVNLSFIKCSACVGLPSRLGSTYSDRLGLRRLDSACAASSCQNHVIDWFYLARSEYFVNLLGVYSCAMAATIFFREYYKQEMLVNFMFYGNDDSRFQIAFVQRLVKFREFLTRFVFRQLAKTPSK